MLIIPTTQQLEAIILADLEAQFGVPINPDGKADLRAQAAVQAASLKQQYLSIANTEKNIWVDTCDLPTLIRFGRIKLGREPFSGIAGRYDVLVNGAVGAVIKANTVYKSDDTALNPGVLYILDDAYTLVATTDTINLRCLMLGEGGKLDVDDTLTSTEPIALVDSGAIVISETIQPLAPEDIEDYRQKVIEAFRLEAQGGAATDYRLWAQDAQGVKSVYPYAQSGVPCGVVVYVEATIADSTDGKGTPSAQTIDDTEAVFEFDPDTSLPQNERGRRPMQVVLDVEPISPQTVEITITGFQNLTAQNIIDLTNAFNAAVVAVRPFVAAADNLADKNDIIDVNKLNSVIYTTLPGSVYTGVTFKINGVPFSTYTFMLGNIPWFNGTIIFN